MINIPKGDWADIANYAPIELAIASWKKLNLTGTLPDESSEFLTVMDVKRIITKLNRRRKYSVMPCEHILTELRAKYKELTDHLKKDGKSYPGASANEITAVKNIMNGSNVNAIMGWGKEHLLKGRIQPKTDESKHWITVFNINSVLFLIRVLEESTTGAIKHPTGKVYEVIV